LLSACSFVLAGGCPQEPMGGTPLPDGFVGQPYNVMLSSAGAPISSSSGAVSPPPPGLDVSTFGTIEGTPSHAGIFSFEVQFATESDTTRTFQITIHPGLQVEPAAATVQENQTTQFRAFELQDLSGMRTDVTTQVQWSSS